MNGWTLDRPEALLLLPLLALLAWLARRGPRAEVHATGALALWKRAAPESAEREAAARHRLPPAAWAALLALTCATLAIAGPRLERRAPRAGPWTLVVDRSPSMFLPPPDAGSNAGRSGLEPTTRYGRAIEDAMLLCERAGVGPEARRWRTFAFDGVHEATGARPPEEWASERWRAGVAVPWGQFDSPRHVWITDGPPRTMDGGPLAPLVAGIVQSGASAVPGPIGDGPETLVAWDGSRLLDAPVPRRSVELDPALGESLADFTRAWASARGLDVVDSTPRSTVDRARVALRVARAEPIAPAGFAPVGSASRAGSDTPGEFLEGRLHLESAAAGHGRLAALGARGYPSPDRDGLRVIARLEATAEAPAPGPVAGALPAIRFAPGELEFALERLDLADVDPAAFAVAFGELFDAAVAPRPDVLPFEERATSGPAESRAPAPGASGAWRSPPVAALLAVLAAAFAALAWLFSEGLRGPSAGRGAPQGPFSDRPGAGIRSGAVRSRAASGSGVD